MKYERPVVCWLLLSLWISLAVGPALAGDPEGWNPNPTEQVVYPDWFLDSFLDLKEDITNARAAGKQGIMVVFSMPYCSFCKKLAQTTLVDPSTVSAIRKDFDAVHVNLFSDVGMVSPTGEPMSVKAFGKREGADFTPAIYFYDLDGKRMLRVVGYHPPQRFRWILSYLSEGHHRTVTLREYLSEQAALAKRPDVARIDDPLFEPPPFILDRRAAPSDRQLMVVFDGPECDECPYVLGELFQDAELRPQIEQMEVVRLSLDDPSAVIRPDGTRITASDWHAELGFHRTPAFVFFDEHGRQVMATDSMMVHTRLNNTLGYVLERAYREGINYQRFSSRRAGKRLDKLRAAEAKGN